jgi:hypothetical protein
MSGQLKRASSIIVASCLMISLLARDNTVVADAAQAIRACRAVDVNSYLQDVRNAYVFFEGSSTAKKTQVTEAGWSTASVSNHVQAQNLHTAFQTFRATTYVARAFWFDIQDIPEATLYYGLVTSTGTQKPGFMAYQKYATY